MNKFSLLMDFIGSLEPSTWISSRGIKAGPYGVLIFCAYVFLRDGMERGFWSLVGYLAAILAIASLIF